MLVILARVMVVAVHLLPVVTAETPPVLAVASHVLPVRSGEALYQAEIVPPRQRSYSATAVLSVPPGFRCIGIFPT